MLGKLASRLGSVDVSTMPQKGGGRGRERREMMSREDASLQIRGMAIIRVWYGSVLMRKIFGSEFLNVRAGFVYGNLQY